MVATNQDKQVLVQYMLQRISLLLIRVCPWPPVFSWHFRKWVELKPIELVASNQNKGIVAAADVSHTPSCLPISHGLLLVF